MDSTLNYSRTAGIAEWILQEIFFAQRSPRQGLHKPNAYLRLVMPALRLGRSVISLLRTETDSDAAVEADSLVRSPILQRGTGQIHTGQPALQAVGERHAPIEVVVFPSQFTDQVETIGQLQLESAIESTAVAHGVPALPFIKQCLAGT